MLAAVHSPNYSKSCGGQMRIQRKGFFDYTWKKNPNAVYVGRPSKWGNPFKVEEYGREKCLEKYREWLRIQILLDHNFIEPLRGRDLVCFCPLNQPCHADIIMEFLGEKT